ncbi:polyprenyl synthetase family protein [Demequina sp. SYSU T00039]|uniref:Polyprenyl synthetase family protein n=1 Tax=Demequina lignilytica TaxID=3051663 RepID=A0AAW7M1K0_9MICO|nr:MULTISPECIES: polyprenyl synthetase family protein [unclassified Demequina]MDN4478047.1 polyprenyl synthetase family protein [Demequina sp. SYSU T00039-1]MDN4488503.1 polyprenyl synthetase family protein [Demequina sp. SYSU T00039]MDN4489950.1 polyprenyl synthetase family protein [Demequina sp. SYSU T00068]
MATLTIGNAALDSELQPRLDLVEERLRDAVAQSDKLADASSRHLVDAGGKRLRPMLVLLCAQLGDGSRPEVLDAAVVVELTHLATLYHDDVMDSAPTRRGAPSAHEVWGNSVAILTGDLLFARASTVVAGLGPAAVRIQAETFERLCIGQLHETVGPDDADDPVAFYLQVLADKTASLIATSARFGAMFGGAPRSMVEQVTRYGEFAGVAFQLADDVIDIRSDAATTGKTPGTDLREGVPTMPVLLLRRRVASPEATDEDRALLAAIDGDLSDDAALADVVARLAVHPVLDETAELARRWAYQAVGAIASLPEGDVKDALGAFAEALVARAA